MLYGVTPLVCRTVASKKIGAVGRLAVAPGRPTPFGHASGWPAALKPVVSMK
jgi:hypothetical protein